MFNFAQTGKAWGGSAYNGADHATKEAFHRAGMLRLRKLAAALDMPAGTFDVRSNRAGMAVSGEVTLHGERIYVQVSHGGICPGIMFRTCDGRRDYCGHRNHFAPLAELDNVDRLAARIRSTLGV